jgi:hypothetical protein
MVDVEEVNGHVKKEGLFCSSFFFFFKRNLSLVQVIFGNIGHECIFELYRKSRRLDLGLIFICHRLPTQVQEKNYVALILIKPEGYVGSGTILSSPITKYNRPNHRNISKNNNVSKMMVNVSLFFMF